MAGLIKDQLSYTREKLKERSEEFIRASDCIKGGESLCVELDMDKVLAKAPPVNHEEVFGRERKKELKRKMEEGGLSSEERGEYRRLLTQESEADGLFERAECLQTQRRAVSGVNRELALGALDVGIVIGTMGLGAPYAAGRIALKLGGALTKAQRMSKAKRLQNAGIFGADASLSAPYMQEAAEACEDSLNQLEETAALGEERGSGNKVCKSLPLRVKHTSDLKGCILQASLASLPITLPLLGLSGIAAARGVKGAKASSMPSSSASKRAEEVLKTKLSPAQRRAVEEAHLAGQGERGKNGALAGIGNYTRDQLRRKAEILDRAGFSRNQRRELIEAGAAGDDILRTAGRELEEGLQEIRMTPQELHFQRAGFKEEYYRGLDQAREFNKVKEWLQKIKADPKRTHIPYFADQVEKTIADFEAGFKKYSQDNPEFLEERLKILEELKKEAGQRIKNQSVAYDWWTNFNLRLSMIAETPDFIEDVLIIKNGGIRSDLAHDPDLRRELGIEAGYITELTKTIAKEMKSYPKSKKKSKDFKKLKKEFEKLSSEGGSESEDLERILYILTKDSFDFNFIYQRKSLIDKILKEKGWFSIDRLKTHEAMEELVSIVKTPAGGRHPTNIVAGLSFFNRTRKSFPEEIMFFTTDELGLMAFNSLEDGSHFIGVSGSPLKADGEEMSAFKFLEHDLEHMELVQRGLTSNVSQQVLDRISSISSKSDREKAELGLFLYRHEIGSDIWELDDRLKNRFFDPDDLQGMLPDSVNVDNRKEVEKFLTESADILTDLLSSA